MIDYTREITLHIQGLGMLFHQAFEEVDNTTQIEIPPDVDIHSISIRKVGGYIPRLVCILYKDKQEIDQQQAYMAKYIDGNLICTPIDEVHIVNPFSLERTLPNSPYGIILYLASNEIKEKGWVGFYQDSIPWNTRTYRKLEVSKDITYLET